MLAVILNQHLIKRRKQEECKTAHSSPPDYETKNIVSSSDGVSCAEKDEKNKNGISSVRMHKILCKADWKRTKKEKTLREDLENRQEPAAY